MSAERQELCTIAKLYYEQNRTQAEIAQRLGFSRPKISRMLAEAKEKGIVKIFIDDGGDDMSDVERRLYGAFNLKAVRVASVPEDDVALAVRITARTGAEFLSKYLEPGDRIGVGWGWTLYEMTRSFPEMSLADTLVCQVTGSVDNAKSRSYAHEIVSGLSTKIGAQTAYTLPCPALVDSPIILDTLLHDIKVRNLLAGARNCNKLFANVALPDESSCLYQAGYLKDGDLDRLRESRAVGSICCRFYDEDCNPCSPELDERTIGISIDDLRKIDCVMACIVGADKARAVYHALRADLLDVLVIDSITASRIIELLDKQ